MLSRGGVLDAAGSGQSPERQSEEAADHDAAGDAERDTVDQDADDPAQQDADDEPEAEHLGVVGRVAFLVVRDASSFTFGTHTPPFDALVLRC
jgi:hypothetical protein